MRTHTAILLVLVGAALAGCGGCDSSSEEAPLATGDFGWLPFDGGPDDARLDDGGRPSGDDFGLADGGFPGDPPVDPGPGEPVPGVSPYLLIDSVTVEHLRERFDGRATHPCEIQAVGDSISESFLFLNPLTNDPRRPDMSYESPTHCRIFGQPTLFHDLPATATSGMTAEWGVESVEDIDFPLRYEDRDVSLRYIGPEEAYPEVATILYGTNDLRFYVLQRMETEPPPGGERRARRAFIASLRGIAEWALDEGIVPVLVTTPPGTYDAWWLTVGEGPAFGERWVRDIRALGRELRVPVFDLNRLVLDQPGWERLFSDGVHPNEEGYRVINDAFYRVYQDLRRHVLVH